LLPVRFDPAPDSVYDRLTRQWQIPVKLWLVQSNGASLFTGKGLVPGLAQASSGSAKVDAYRWAVANYVVTGKCDARYAAYYIDGFWLASATRAGADLHTLSNHDFSLAHKAFFFDLSPWGDEAPNDDLTQSLGLDRQALADVMRALAGRVPDK